MSATLSGFFGCTTYLAGELLLCGSAAALRLRSHAAQDAIAAWHERINLFFILGIGRSGSMFLSRLLDRAPRARVCHEPVLADFAAYTRAYLDDRAAQDYLRRFRRVEIYLRLRHEDVNTYGEVNSNLRRHCRALRREFPSSTLVHVVRDGRDVVRSMMSRRTYRAWDPVTSLIHPDDSDPWASEWARMSRFEKLCWYWLVENRYLRKCVGRTVQLEKLLSDYAYFQSRLLAPLGLEIREGTWRESVSHPSNVTERYRIQHWSDWDKEKRRVFEGICGEEMARNGYELNW